MNIDNEREKFEAVLSKALIISKDYDYFAKYTTVEFLGQYVDGDVQNAWIEWQARAKQSEAEIAELRAQVEALSKDKVRLDWLIANEYQVWETNGKYQIHHVTEHNSITQFFYTARDAIDQAKDNQ